MVMYAYDTMSGHIEQCTLSSEFIVMTIRDKRLPVCDISAMSRSLVVM